MTCQARSARSACQAEETLRPGHRRVRQSGPDARVNFSTKSGTVAPARAVSDARGRAALTWKLGSKPGEQKLTGVVRGSDVTGEYVTQVGGPEAVAKTSPPKPAALKPAAVRPVPAKSAPAKARP